jgi:hypothetical protein
MVKRIRPSLKGSWVLLFGIILGPAIILSGRDPSGRIWLWILLSLFFVAFFLHRLSLLYIISDDSLIFQSWWGLGRPEKISLNAIDRIEVFHGFSQRLVGCGHIHVHSADPQEGSITIVSQPKAPELASELQALGNRLSGADVDPFLE